MRKLLFILLLFITTSASGQFFAPYQKPNLGLQVNWAQPPSQGLVGLWLFNEGSGNKVFDLSGNGNNGTTSGTTPVWVAGKFGPALSFDGSDDLVTMTRHSEITLSTAWTVSCWARRTSSGVLDALFSMGDGTNTIGMAYLDDTTAAWNGLLVQRKNSGGPQKTSKPLTSIRSVTTEWHHYGFVFSGNDADVVAIYFDGVLNSTTPGITLGSVTNDRIAIAAAAGGFNGAVEIDDFMIWNRALSASEIALLYREPFCMFRPSWNWILYGGISVPAAGGAQVIYIN